MNAKTPLLAAFSVTCFAACAFGGFDTLLDDGQVSDPTPRAFAVALDGSTGFVADDDGGAIRFFDPADSTVDASVGIWSGWEVAALAADGATGATWALHDTGIVILWDPSGYSDYSWLPSSGMDSWCDVAAGDGQLWVTGVQTDGQTRLFYNDGTGWDSKLIGTPPSCVALDYDSVNEAAAALFGLGASHAVIEYQGLKLVSAATLPTEAGSADLFDLESEAGTVMVVGYGGSPHEPADVAFVELSQPSEGAWLDFEGLDLHEAFGVALSGDRDGITAYVAGAPLDGGAAVVASLLEE